MKARKVKDVALLEELERLRRRVSELERGHAGSAPPSDRHGTQAMLRRRERQIQEAQQIASMGWWEWDIPSDTVTWSEGLYRIFGLEAGGFQATYEGFLQRVHPDDRDRVKRIVDSSFRSCRPFAYDARILRPDGAGRWIQARGEVEADGGGRAIRMLGTVIDISERRRADEEILKVRKLESVGVLAGGIAHDFNNLLTVMLGNVLLIKTRLESDDPDLGKLEDAEEACIRARRLTHQLLTFAEGGAPIKRTAFLSTLLEDACRLTAASGAPVRTDLSLPPDLWPVEVDEGQIGQVFGTLMANASQAMPSGGTIHISAANLVNDEAAVPSHGHPGPGRYVRLTVRDEGIGIAPDDLPRIFDPYFSTPDRGSGLGLAAAFSIVQRHGGAIRAESRPGRGTTFTIDLPAATGLPAGHEAPEPCGATEEIHGGRILVMDDEALVRVMIGDMLRHFGYDVVLTADGTEAVEEYRRAFRDGARFTAVILDLMVPGGVGGKETMRRLLEIDPEVRGIVASGYSNDPVMAEYRRHGFRGVVAKPFRLDELRRTLRQVAGGAPAAPREKG